SLSPRNSTTSDRQESRPNQACNSPFHKSPIAQALGGLSRDGRLLVRYRLGYGLRDPRELA
ncbi:MAG TPA: hypothetical protein VMM56_06025, partial [Planctomycetaceae bacterium]|nr:hypothetical protein [Planctomycetaceae bacterium]